jgi:hypothetical protein
VALVRVYCGVATAELAPWLTVAVVDDSGRLVDMRHVSDDPIGYASLVAVLADRSAGPCPVAVDRPEHIVGQLLAAANRPLTVTDEMMAREVTERFADESSYEEMQAPPSQRRAVGLARALQAGALYATPVSPGWELEELKPVLAAHAALVAGRQASAAALREVLRELYPAALRAYLDPAELIPLAVLEAFPEPSMIASGQHMQAVVAELAGSGLTDATTASNAVTALRVAVDESRSRANPYLAPAVAATVRQAVAAVRACDAAAESLVVSLVERIAGISRQSHPASAPVSPAVPRQPADAAAWADAGFSGSREPASSHIPAPRPEPSYPPMDAGFAAVGAARADAFAGRSAAGPSPYGPGANGNGNGTSRASGWEQQFGPAPTSPAPRAYGPDTLSFSTDPLTAPLDAPRGTAHVAPRPGQPTAAAPGTDEDLLIFSQAGNSVWFADGDADTLTWTNLSADEGWRAAEHLTQPSVGPETTGGLPRRVPQANLVPGSVSIAPDTGMPRIVRDPRRIAAHTDGYFRGWRRGQEVGGFAVGQRDRAAWEFNREQRARQGATRLS